MADKKWTHLKLKNGDNVSFIPPAPDGAQLGGITQSQRESISQIQPLKSGVEQVKTDVEQVKQDVTQVKDDYLALDGRVTALENTPPVDPELELRVEKLEAAAEGNLYLFREDDSEAYEKAVPADALKWATLDKLGGKTLVMNQVVNYEKIACSSPAIIPTLDANGVWTFPKSQNVEVIYFGYRIELVANHAYLMRADYFYNGTGTFSVNWNNVQHIVFNPSENWQHFEKIYTPASVTASLFYQICRAQGIAYGEQVKAKNIMLIDLTQMFGAGNEPTAVEFRDMFPADYYPYSEPTLMSFEPKEMVNNGSNLITFDKWRDTTANGVAFKREGDTIVLSGTSTAIASSFVSYFDEPIKLKAGIIYAPAHSTAIQTYLVSEKADGTNRRWLTGTVSVSQGEYAKYWYVNILSGTKTDGVVLKPYAGYSSQYASPRNPIATDISALVNKYFPDGMHSVGSVHDEIDLERGVAVKRVGTVDLGQMEWKKSTYGDTTYRTENMAQNHANKNLITARYVHTSNTFIDMPNMTIRGTTTNLKLLCLRDDSIDSTGALKASLQGVMLYYELAEPIETSIDPADLEGLTDVEVEAGGSLTFVNQHGDDFRMPIPNQETWMIKLGGNA